MHAWLLSANHAAILPARGRGCVTFVVVSVATRRCLTPLLSPTQLPGCDSGPDLNETSKFRVPVKRHRGSRDTHGTHTGHAGAQGHTDHTAFVTQTNLTTIQTHQHTTRTSARRPKPRPTQQPQARLPAADSEYSKSAANLTRKTRFRDGLRVRLC